MIGRKLLLAAALVAGCTVAVLLAAGPAAAATHDVDCAPAGSDNLQTAITAAAPGDTLLIEGTCTGTFTVNKNLTLQGDAAGATLNGGGNGTTLTISGLTPPSPTVNVRALTITGGNGIFGGGLGDIVATVNLVNTTVRGNTARFVGGGGILDFLGTLTVTGSTVTDNQTASGGFGGGIALAGNPSAGQVSVIDSTVSKNTAPEGYEGGGISTEYGTLTLSGSTVIANSASFGAGIATYHTATVITTSRIVDNTIGSGGGVGGGIANWGGGSLTLDGSTVTDNSAGDGGGLFNVADSGTTSVVVTGSTLDGNRATYGGGAIYNLCNGGTVAQVTVANSTIGPPPNTLNDSNQATLGGGIYNDGTGNCPSSISLQSGTHVVRNIASTDGGGVYNTGVNGTLSLTGATFLLNSPDAVSDESPGGNS